MAYYPTNRDIQGFAMQVKADSFRTLLNVDI